MSGSSLEDLLAEQRHYYAARAGEYEDWWFRRGRYAHDTESTARWFADVAAAHDALARFAPGGKILELACGTGLWTEQLAPRAELLSAVDGSEEVLSLAQARVPDRHVEWVRADLFAWEPSRRYDVCFFAFWLSHVPSELMGPFWAKVARALAPGGRVFMIDSADNERASPCDHHRSHPGEQIELRRVADGREFRVVKHWFDAPTLERTIEQVGWSAQIVQTEFFVYGEAAPPGSRIAASGA